VQSKPQSNDEGKQENPDKVEQSMQGSLLPRRIIRRNLEIVDGPEERDASPAEASRRSIEGGRRGDAVAGKQGKRVQEADKREEG